MRGRLPVVGGWLLVGNGLCSKCQPLPLHLAFLLCLFFSLLASHSSLLAQTVYAVVFGDQSKVVGASTLNSGLFRSHDFGETWEHLGPQNLKAFSMDAVESAGGRVLFIAAGNGVHRSLDSGRTWRVVTDWRVTEVLDVAVKQDDPRWVYAATAYGVWYSNDTGSTWRPARDTALGRYAYRLYARGNRLEVARESDVLSVPLPDLDTARASTLALLPLPRARLATGHWAGRGVLVHPLRFSSLPVKVEHQDDTLPPMPEITPPDSGLPRGANWYDAARTKLFFSTFLAGDKGVWRHGFCADDLWGNISTGLPTEVVHALAEVRTSSHEALFAGTWGHGVWRYEDSKWRASGLDGCQVWRLVVKSWK